jgi:hypothetical protein
VIYFREAEYELLWNILFTCLELVAEFQCNILAATGHAKAGNTGRIDDLKGDLSARMPCTTPIAL